jgi:PleD family two-component response regulator
MARADAALYRAKRGGRDRVEAEMLEHSPLEA